MSETVSMADIAPYCFLFRGSIFFATVLLSRTGHFSRDDTLGPDIHIFSNAPEQIETEQDKQSAHNRVNPVSEPAAIEALENPSRRRPYKHDRQTIADAVEKQQQPAIHKALFVGR